LDGGKSLAKYELNSAEEQYQLGLGDSVLVNKLGMTDIDKMDVLESTNYCWYLVC